MPSTDDVRDELVDIVVQVLGCDPDAVTDTTTFRSLGSDSLTIVEIGEELGRRFDLYLADETIDQLRTVQDAIQAVVRHDGAPAPKGASVPIPATLVAAPAALAVAEAAPTIVTPPEVEAEPVALTPPPVADEPLIDFDPETSRHAWRSAGRLTLIGLIAGATIGLGGFALVSATGLGDVSLPPLPSSTSTPEPTETTPSPTPTPSRTTDSPKPTIETAKTQVSPGERFILEGRFPELGADADLQVEVRDPGGEWDDFPVTTKTRGEGEFKTELFTTRTGPREFRLKQVGTGQTTPTVKVTIG